MAHRIGNTDYEVISTGDGKFGVKIFAPNALPQVVEGFSDQTEAEEWIFEQDLVPSDGQGKYGPFSASDN